MSLETYFSIVGTLAMSGWVILIFLPRRWPLVNRIPALYIPVLLSLTYSVFIGLYFFSAEGGFDTLANVQTLFLTPEVALAGWVHYLAFDLLVGSWVARQSDQLNISRLIQAPILVLSFMFAPLGYLLFVMIRAFLQRVKNKVALQEGLL